MIEISAAGAGPCLAPVRPGLKMHCWQLAFGTMGCIFKNTEFTSFCQSKWGSFLKWLYLTDKEQLGATEVSWQSATQSGTSVSGLVFSSLGLDDCFDMSKWDDIIWACHLVTPDRNFGGRQGANLAAETRGRSAEWNEMEFCCAFGCQRMKAVVCSSESCWCWFNFQFNH